MGARPVLIVLASIGIPLIGAVFFASVAAKEGARGYIGRIAWGVCQGKVRKTCVVDGDTLWYKSEKFRLYGFDAPEASKPRCRREGKMADRATYRLIDLLSSGSVRFQFKGYDSYNRSLASFWVDDRPVSEIMIDEGLAIPYSPQAHKVGIWCG